MKEKNKNETRSSRVFEKWTSENGLAIIAGYLRNGATIADICKNVLCVSRVTFYKWCKRSEALKETATITREAADMIVENSLFKRAVGFKYKEETMTRDGPIEIERYCPADVKAQELWLRNRRPSKWRLDQIESNKNEGVELNVKIQIEDTSSAELKSLDDGIDEGN